MLRWFATLRFVSLGAAFGSVSFVLTQRVRSGDLAPAAAASCLGTLWLGQLLTLTVTEPLTRWLFTPKTTFAPVKDTSSVTTGLHVVEATFAMGLLVLHPTRVVCWLVGIFSVQAAVFHLATSVAQRGLKESRYRPKNGPLIHNRWRAEHENWWLLQRIKVDVGCVVADVVKIVLLGVYVAEQLEQLK